MQIFEISTTLFKRDSKGNVRVWWYETGFDKNGNWGWRTNSGIKDGKTVTSGWTIVEEKNIGRANATTLEQQASAEAHAEWVKKRDRGYFDRIGDIDKFDKIKPMLATKYEDHKLDFEENLYYSQPKLDGIRCIARKDGLWTRAGKEIVAVPHINDQLSNFFEIYPDTVLDGELYNHDLRDDFNKITSVVRKTKPKQEDVEEAEQIAQYHVYDMIRMPSELKEQCGESPFFNDRYSWLKQFLPQVSDVVKIVPTAPIQTTEQLDELYGEYLKDGYEGQMVRLCAEYQENKRSKYLIKRKEFNTEEFVVVSVEEGNGNWAGYVKRFVLRLPDGREFGAGVRGNQQTLRDLFVSEQKPDWATVRFFTPTPDGIPRFPVVIDWGTGKRED